MKKKVLFVATIAGHIKAFHLSTLAFFKREGWEVHVAIGKNSEIEGEKILPECDKMYILSFKRTPFSSSNLSAVGELKKIIEREHFALIHCHTPMGGVVGRLAARKSRIVENTKVFYTCHGAHFYTGAPILNWFVYYPIEKYLAHFTDCFIAINQEDFQRAEKHIKAKKVAYIPGVGFKNNFCPTTKEEKKEIREQLGIRQDTYVLMYVGELNRNKNQKFLIEIMNLLKSKCDQIELYLIGAGPEEEEIKKQIFRYDLQEKVKLLGYRRDVNILLKAADLYVSASLREGLPVNIMEALASGIPVVATKVRGQKDLLEDGKNGFVINIGDKKNFMEKVMFFFHLQDQPEQMEQFRKNAADSVTRYSCQNVQPLIENLYKEYMR